jgi:hypothetical protein
VSRTPGRGIVDTSEGVGGCHLVVVRLAVVARLAFHLCVVSCTGRVPIKKVSSTIKKVIRYYLIEIR